jgi:hypothetical protein
MPPRLAHRTSEEWGLLGDGAGNVRVAASDDLVVRTATGRVQFATYNRADTGEVTFAGGVYTPTTVVPSNFVEGTAVLLERQSGRAPNQWRVVSIVQSATSA